VFPGVDVARYQGEHLKFESEIQVIQGGGPTSSVIDGSERRHCIELGIVLVLAKL
jgi:hypothetical protein